MDIRKPPEARCRIYKRTDCTELAVPIDFIVGKQEFRHLTNISNVKFINGSELLKVSESHVYPRAGRPVPEDRETLRGKKISWPITIWAQDAMGKDELILLLKISGVNGHLDGEEKCTLELSLEFDGSKEISLKITLSWFDDGLFIQTVERTHSPLPLALSLTALTLTHVTFSI